MSHSEAADGRAANRPERRRFTPEYKLRIVQEIDRGGGEKRNSSAGLESRLMTGGKVRRARNAPGRSLGTPERPGEAVPDL